MPHKYYTGKESGSPGDQPVKIPRQPVEGKEQPPEELQPYFPDPELVRAVNIALLLDRPLLVMGEPGCGKSLLAKDIAWCWYGKEMYTKDKYFAWNIKSTSKAKEGLYEFDYLRRLYDANSAKGNADDKQEDAGRAANYVIDGPLAKAMRASSKDEKAILLIDEIDKADIDFSNDLLNELEQNSYTIAETMQQKSFTEKPFIVITSNSEKDLSDAFLRRCVFHYIELFSNDKLKTNELRDWLKKIIEARYYKGRPTENPMIKKAIDTFIRLRSQMNGEMLIYRKTVSTSEFLDWFSVLKKCFENTSLASDMQLDAELQDWLTKPDSPLSFGNALFKTKSLLDLKTATISTQ